MSQRFDHLAKELAGVNARERLKRVGQQTVPDVEIAVQRTPAKAGSLADLSMSGWRKRGGDPLQLSGAFEVLSDNELEMRPGLRNGNWRQGAGPMRVLESGRKTYQAGTRRAAGSYVSRKTGEVRTKTRRVKRNTGATEGKGTWSDAEQMMAAEMAARWHTEWVRSMGGYF